MMLSRSESPGHIKTSEIELLNSIKNLTKRNFNNRLYSKKETFMQNPIKALVFFSILFLFYSGSICQAKQLETIDNLKKSYVVESNMYNKYSKFAVQAAKDGYPIVAKLFQSAAFSELMHARNHAAAIEGLGSKTAKLELKDVTVKSTIENLKSSSRDEQQDEIKMYVQFMEQADKDGLRDAHTSFKFASDSEVQHRQLFAKAEKNMGPKDVDYYVDVNARSHRLFNPR
jgi:rubrerythrin